ncbi:MAG: zinc ribbon domain-containing protein [Oscillospiraceae bacterium]|nr:zinc ribbon domain-containing protein [Oscillospiraceae bacterium]
MYCQKCGQELRDDARFCIRCGAQTAVFGDYCAASDVQLGETEDRQTASAGTAYASTSFKFSMFGLICICCCGLELLAGIPAVLFGIAALRNHEPERLKAYIGLILGILEILFFVFLMIAGANSV